MEGLVHGRLRDPVSGLTHLVAALSSMCGLGLLLYIARGDQAKQVFLLVYGVSLALMFSASAAYHLIIAGPRISRLLRTLDHAAIYLLIAGSYTPICLYFFTGFYRWGLLGIVWALALIGVGAKVFVINAPRWFTAGVYLLMGWMSILAIKQMVLAMPLGALLWLFAGGLFFTVGAIVYITKWPDFWPDVFGFHELWHIFVILGCTSHYVVVAVYVAT